MFPPCWSREKLSSSSSSLVSINIIIARCAPTRVCKAPGLVKTSKCLQNPIKPLSALSWTGRSQRSNEFKEKFLISRSFHKLDFKNFLTGILVTIIEFQRDYEEEDNAEKMSINGISQLVKTSSLASTVHTPLLMHHKELFKGGSKSGDEQMGQWVNRLPAK